MTRRVMTRICGTGLNKRTLTPEIVEERIRAAQAMPPGPERTLMLRRAMSTKRGLESRSERRI